MKMSDTGGQVIQSVPQYAEIAIRFLEELRKMLEIHAQNHENAKAHKEMAEYVKNGGTLKTFIARDFSEKDFVDELQKMGCTCVTARITQGPYKGLIACMVKEDDLAKALIAREKALSHGTQIADEFGNIYSPTTEMSIPSLQSQIVQDKASCIKTDAMCDAKAKFLIEQLRGRNIPFSRVESQKEIECADGKKTIPMTSFYASSKDREKVAQCLARTEIEFAGISGNYRNQTIKNSLNKIEEAKSYIDSTSAKEEFYVVSAVNPYNSIHVEAHKVTHEINDGNGKTTAYRAVDGLYDHADMQKVFKEEVDSMRSPLLFTESEYHQAMSDPEFMKKMVDKKLDYPQYRSKQDKLNCITERQIKKMFNQKIYPQIAQGIFNPEAEREEFAHMIENQYPLEAYLNPFSNEDMKFLQGLSDDECQIAKKILDDCLSCYEHADIQIKAHTITEKERTTSLDDLIRDAENSLDYSVGIDVKNLDLGD